MKSIALREDSSAAVRRELEQESIDYFVSFVQVLGLPRSIGQIYGLLFVSTQPLTMSDIVVSLGISKGSVSQGLALLKSLGAVTFQPVRGSRCEHYQADLNVSRIVRHFFENRLQPRLERGGARLESLMVLAQKMDRGSSSELTDRVLALQKWQRRGLNLFPLLFKWLRR